MTKIAYNWNPFNTDDSCVIVDEVITVQGGNKSDLIPRYAPFHKDGFVLVDGDSGKVLKAGVNYDFILPFDELNETKSVDVVGGLVIMDDVIQKKYIIKTYATVGDPFVLSDKDYAALAANIGATTRKGIWSQVVNLPMEGFPPNPHEHKADTTLGYDDFVALQKEGNTALANEVNNPTVKTQLTQHASTDFKTAHPNAKKSDLGLGNVANYKPATEEDLKGDSDQLYVTVAKCRLLAEKILKELGIYPDDTETNPSNDNETGSDNSKIDYDKKLTYGEALNSFLKQTALLSEIKVAGSEAQAIARDNLGLKAGALIEVLNELGDSTTMPVSQKVVTDLLSKLNYDAESWVYTAVGGETTITPPYDYLNCIMFINGLAQPTSYSFTIVDGVIHLPEALRKGEVVEIISDAPIVKSYMYTAKGGEKQITTTHELNNALLYINGFEQPYGYSFYVEGKIAYLAEALLEGDLCELTFDIPLTSQHAVLVNQTVAELKTLVTLLQEEIKDLKGVDFISKDVGNVLTSGTDENILLDKGKLQYIKSADTTTKVYEE